MWRAKCANLCTKTCNNVVLCLNCTMPCTNVCFWFGVLNTHISAPKLPKCFWAPSMAVLKMHKAKNMCFCCDAPNTHTSAPNAKKTVFEMWSTKNGMFSVWTSGPDPVQQLQDHGCWVTFVAVGFRSAAICLFFDLCTFWVRFGYVLQGRVKIAPGGGSVRKRSS